MKKQLLFAILLFFICDQIKAQCAGGSSFSSVTAPTSSTPSTISSCNWGGDYNTINGCLAGTSYTFTASGNAFITIRQGSSNGTVVGYGASTVTITSPISGTLYMLINSNPSCGIGTTCITTTIVRNSTTLPVSFGKFTATVQKNQVKLAWNTFSETNSEAFIVYRSTDGVNYIEIARQASKGSATNGYTSFDNYPVSGANYYRLKQRDIDGTVATLADDAVNFSLGTKEVKAWPNPIDNILRLSFPTATYQNLELVDIGGRKLQEHVLTNTQNEIKLDMSTYAKGVYLIILKDPNNSYLVKVLK